MAPFWSAKARVEQQPHAPVGPAQGDLSAADTAGGTGAVRPTVDPDRFREALRARVAADIKKVPGIRLLTFEIDQVNCPLGIGDRLRLDPVVRYAKERDLRLG